MKTYAELEAELDAMLIGINCTNDEFMEKIYERNGALIREEIDAEIVEEIIKLSKDK